MAKNIVIQEDGTEHTYQNVKKIRTKAIDGGYITWVPVDDVTIFPKAITENGTYEAEDDDVYGYEYVTVNVSNVTIGKRGSKTVAITTDNEGYIMEMVIPDSIRIANNPTKMIYANGESVDISGIVIKAYADGDLWTTTAAPNGVVVLSEVTVSPQKITTSNRTVTISWPRPADNKMLTVNYQVQVS